MRAVKDKAILGGILAVVGLLAVPIVVLPAGRAQAIFLMVAKIMAGGGLPYTDAFDLKPPGIHFVYLAARPFAGDAMWGPRVLDVVALLLGTAGLFTLLRPVDRLAAVLASLHFGVAYARLVGFWDLTQPESFMIPAVLWGFVAARRSGRLSLILAGAALGFAFLLKYTIVFFLPLFIWMIWQSARSDAGTKSVQELVSRSMFLGAGALIPVAGTLIYLAAGGALREFWIIQTDFNPGYTRILFSGGIDGALEMTGRGIRVYVTAKPFLFVPAGLGLVSLLALGHRGGRWLPVLGALMAFAGIAAQGKYFEYHWIPIYPFLAWLTGMGLSRLLQTLRNRRSFFAIAAAALVVIVAWTWSPSVGALKSERASAVRYILGRESQDAFYGSRAFGKFGTGDFSLVATEQAAKRTAEVCPPQGRVLVWGFEPLVYLKAQRAHASRFIYTSVLLAEWAPDQWKSEIQNSLRENPPEVLIVVSADRMPWVNGTRYDSSEGLQAFKGITDLLARHYRPAGQVEHFTFFQRTDLPQPAQP